MRMLLLTTLIIFASSATAGLYKWVDNEGNVHYSQKRPKNIQYKKLKAPAAPPVSSKPLYQAEKAKTSADGALVEEEAKIKKLRTDNCEKAKKSLNTYTVYRRLRDKDGNVRIIDANERTKQIEDAKKAIKDFC